MERRNLTKSIAKQQYEAVPSNNTFRKVSPLRVFDVRIETRVVTVRMHLVRAYAPPHAAQWAANKFSGEGIESFMANMSDLSHAMPRRSRTDTSGRIIYDHVVCGETFTRSIPRPTWSNILWLIRFA